MFDRLGITVVQAGPRFPAQLRLWVNGEDVLATAVGEGGRGPFARDALAATYVQRRVELGEPDCTGGCCGYLTVAVQRFGPIVEWSAWEVPAPGTRPLEFHFEASEYDTEVRRAAAAWQRMSARSTGQT